MPVVVIVPQYSLNFTGAGVPAAAEAVSRLLNRKQGPGKIIDLPGRFPEYLPRGTGTGTRDNRRSSMTDDHHRHDRNGGPADGCR